MKLLLTDDHFVVRSGLVASLELEDDIEVVGEADSGEQCLQLYRETVPDVVLLDLQLPEKSGVETTADLLGADSEARVLIFSTFARDEEIREAFEAGALGYLQKSADREDLLEAIRTVAEGGTYLPAELAERLADLRLGPSITGRERQVIALVARGRANKEIAAELGIAEDTVKRHVSNLFQKFGAADRAQATAEAIRRGIVRMDG